MHAELCRGSCSPTGPLSEGICNGGSIGPVEKARRAKMSTGIKAIRVYFRNERDIWVLIKSTDV